MVMILELNPGRNANGPGNEFDETAEVTEHLMQEVAPFVSPDIPTREVEEEFNDANGNFQGVRSHITSTSGARNLEREEGVSNDTNPRSVRSTGSHATNRSVLSLALAASSVVLLGTGLHQGSSVVFSLGSAVSIMTIISSTSVSLGEKVSQMMNSLARMLSFADDPQRRTSDLMKVLGFRDNEINPFMECICIESIAGFTGIEEAEWFEAACEVKISELRCKRLWLGLCAFRRYYETFERRKGLGGNKGLAFTNDFSVSSYNDICHRQVVNDYLRAKEVRAKEIRAIANSASNDNSKLNLSSHPRNVHLETNDSLVSPIVGSQATTNMFRTKPPVRNQVPCDSLT